MRKNIRISSRSLIAVIAATSGTLSWFFMLEVYFASIYLTITNNQFWVFASEAIFFGSSVLFALVGGNLSDKINRKNFFAISIAVGVFASASMAIFQGIAFSLIISILLGLSLGFSFPISTAWLADRTIVEERARVCGIVVLGTFIIVSLAAGVVSFLGLGILGEVALITVLRATSFVAIALDDFRAEPKGAARWGSILFNKNFAFYLVPWIMFNLASGLVSFAWLGLPLSADYDTIFRIAVPLRYGGAAIFGLISGFLADRVGRKQPIVIGLVFLGTSFAILGLATSPITVLVYLVVSGTAWGGFMVIYLAICGDLSSLGSREKFYALGMGIPLVIYMSISSLPTAFGLDLPASKISPILSTILFMSIIPVLLAVETLPESKIRERKLKEHIKEVGKIIQESEEPER